MMPKLLELKTEMPDKTKRIMGLERERDVPRKNAMMARIMAADLYREYAEQFLLRNEDIFARIKNATDKPGKGSLEHLEVMNQVIDKFVSAYTAQVKKETTACDRSEGELKVTFLCEMKKMMSEWSPEEQER